MLLPERREGRQEASPWIPKSRILPTRGAKRGQEVKRKLSQPPFRGELGELTMRLPVRT